MHRFLHHLIWRHQLHAVRSSLRGSMIFFNSTRKLIALVGVLASVGLYQQTRVLYLHLGVISRHLDIVDRPYLQLPHLLVPEKEAKPVRKWAYAFLIGGCSKSLPDYKGFLYNVIVAAQRLKEFGSRADVVVMIQMSTHSNETSLPSNEREFLDAMGVHVHYIPKMAGKVHEVFYSLVKEKFRILDLTEYSRVLFMDSDVMPFCNLDYLFDLSEPEIGEPMLKENVVLAWHKEAANAGFFMLRPDKEDYRLLEQVIRAKEEKALTMPFPYWDPVEGWGHKIEAPDYWRSQAGVTGTNWTWHAVFADQGLLYYWTKYVKQSVSLIIHDEIENWGSKDGKAHFEMVIKDSALKNYSCTADDSIDDDRPSPYRDFVHFTGRTKPWEAGNHTLLRSWRGGSTADLDKTRDSLEWILALAAAANKTNATLDFSFVKGSDDSKPPVGRFSTYGQMIDHITARSKQNWTHYAI